MVEFGRHVLTVYKRLFDARCNRGKGEIFLYKFARREICFERENIELRKVNARDESYSSRIFNQILF